VRGADVLEERDHDFLFTHRGFSGPSVLDLSRHLTAPGAAAAGTRLQAHWGGPEVAWEVVLAAGGPKQVATVLRERLPERLAVLLQARAGVPRDRRLAELPRPERQRLLAHLVACELSVAGSEGYRTAEVTAGGVVLDEVSPRRLESRRVPGLYVAGEMLDAVGRLGGYNFLWAWVTGRKVGQALAAAGPA
jgi:predicted Rossmann fold flavoprotein